jgi:hypothetical protein
MYDPPPKLSKNVVTLAEMPIFTNGEAKYPLAAPIEFFIWAKYLPITLSWDRNDWDQYSLSGSFLVPHWFYQTIPQWHQNPFLDDYACMAYDSDFTTSFNEIWESEKIATTWYRPWEIEGLGIDTLQILELAPKYKYAFLNPCFGSGTNDEVIALFGLKVYPTITEDNVNIYAETQFEKIEVYNFQGQLEQSFEGNEVNISLRDLSSGYKVLMLYHHSSRPIAIRVLKV